MGWGWGTRTVPRRTLSPLVPGGMGRAEGGASRGVLGGFWGVFFLDVGNDAMGVFSL